MEEQILNLGSLKDALLAVATHILLLFINWIDWLFTEHLLLSNIISASLLLGLADFSIQTLEVYVIRMRAVYDRLRNYRSMKVGLVLGVFNHLWYAFLESSLPQPGLTGVFFKIALDQVVAGPFFSSAFLVGMGLLEGKSKQEVYLEWRQKFIHIYMVDWMFWPLAQFINFYLIPYRYRVFYVNFATFLWNTFLCYAKHCSEELIKGHRRTSSTFSVHRHHSIGEGKKLRSKSKSSRSRSPPKSRSKSQIESCSSICCSETKRRTTSKTKLSRRSPSLTLARGKPMAICDKPASLKTTMAMKKHLSQLRKQCHGSDSEIGCEENSWVSEDAKSCAAPLNMSGSSSSNFTSKSERLCCPSSLSSITSVATRSTTAKRSFIITTDTAATHCVKMPIVKKLGVFARADDLKSSSVRKSLPRGKLQTRKVLTMRGTSSGTHPTQKPDVPIAPRGITKKMWVGPAAARAAGAVHELQMVHLRSQNQALEDMRESLRVLKNLVTVGHRELRDALEETRTEIAQLQELCAVTYMTVEECTRDLAEKADQLTSWVTAQRKVELEQIRKTIEEVIIGKRERRYEY